MQPHPRHPGFFHHLPNASYFESVEERAQGRSQWAARASLLYDYALQLEGANPGIVALVAILATAIACALLCCVVWLCVHTMQMRARVRATERAKS